MGNGIHCGMHNAGHTCKPPIRGLTHPGVTWQHRGGRAGTALRRRVVLQGLLPAEDLLQRGFGVWVQARLREHG